MTKYRTSLPQAGDRLFVTDGGIETALIFHNGIDLPHFAAFTLLDSAHGRQTLREYFDPYVRLARSSGTGLVLETPTWRASPDWAEKLGVAGPDLDRLNRDAVGFMAGLRRNSETVNTPMVISGCVGPRGDGYDPGAIMSVETARDYHVRQIGIFAESEADFSTALTMTNANEATGIARAARDCGIPVAIAFTVETDGKLPTGQRLDDAIDAVDQDTSGSVAYFMVNCAHPTHFDRELEAGSASLRRIRGIRANASRCSHEELDNATELDEGNPAELGAQLQALRARHPQITVLGGCCGTDHRHIEAIVTRRAAAA